MGFGWALLVGPIVLVSGQIRVLFPNTLKKVFSEDGPLATSNGVIPASTATFGSPAYGESFVGRLLLINSTSCEADYADVLAAQYNITSPSKNHHEGNSVRDVFLIPRGKCAFVRKVANAESLGADAVVIMDSADSSWDRRQISQVILADDGNGVRIRIPSVLVEKSDGEALAGAAAKGPPPIISMEWNLPQKEVVRVDFWFTNGFPEAYKFLRAMKPIVEKLQNIVDFRPHYYVLRVAADAHNEELVSQMCFKDDPNLCALPPYAGTSGTAQDALKENLRQMALLELYSKPIDGSDSIEGRTRSQIWWNYVTDYPTKCSFGEDNANEKCSAALMQAVGADSSEVLKYVEANALNLLETQKNNNAWGNLALRVNGARFSGSLEPSLVLRAICSAFEDEPAQCREATAAIVLPHETATDTVVFGLWNLLGALTIVSVAVAGFTWAYQQYSANGMRRALRHEVMLEVKSQLQDYYRVDDAAANQWNAPKETEFTSLKFR